MHSCRLAVAFDPLPLQAEVRGLAPQDWVPHFNAHYHDGGWDGVPLRSVGAAEGHLFTSEAGVSSSAPESFADTTLLARCPGLRNVLDAFHCPLLSVRLLRLLAGHGIHEHRDDCLSLEDGTARLHIPLLTNPGVEFYLQGQRVVMNEGETWYLNLSLPHRVHNHGTSDRVHLVIDCAVNDWLRGLISAAANAPQNLSPADAAPGFPVSAAEQLKAFSDVVLGDAELARRLSGPQDTGSFVELLVQAGAERGYRFVAEDVRAVSRQSAVVDGKKDGVMTASFDEWVPIRLGWRDEEPYVDWCRIGDNRFTEPFFSGTIDRCLRHPFTLMFRRETPMEELARWREMRPGIPPTGFIFHVSRCGSTLVSRMLAALPGSVMLSEPDPIDDVLRSHRKHPATTDQQRVEWLRGMVSALGQPRGRGESRLFIKFDAWGLVDLPIIQAAFPETPSIFLYRDPVEVLVSHMRSRGIHMVPGMVEPEAFGMSGEEAAALPPLDYCGRVLARLFALGLGACRYGQAVPLNYSQLPAAVETTLLRSYGMTSTREQSRALEEVARYDAKNPGFVFEDDTQRKNREATDPIRQSAEQWVVPLYEELEAIRAGSPSASRGASS